MKLVFIGIIALIFTGCMAVKKGDYVTYTSDEYLFIHDGFYNQSIDCLELGEIKQGGLNSKYCLGTNYGSGLVQGFIFEHKYTRPEERLIGAKLSFKAKQTYIISCTSETVDDADSGTEYINCMIPQRNFDIYAFIMSSRKEVHGKFHAAVGDRKVYEGLIEKEGKKLLRQFYKDVQKKENSKWKSGNL